MTTFVHFFGNRKLVLTIQIEGPKEDWFYQWIPELQTLQELEELEEAFCEWMGFHSQRFLNEDRVLDALKFEATCDLEWNLRHQKLEHLAS